MAANPKRPISPREYAKVLWDTSPSRPHSPAWEQLGSVTQQVWIERAEVCLNEQEVEDDDDTLQDSD
jgi:hypothetical protein